MKTTYKPVFTLIICLATLCVSLFVAYQLSGSLFGKARVIHLAAYGGLTVDSIINFQWWRFVTSQLVHVHQMHMLLNVISMLVLGLLLEPRIGIKYTSMTWLIAGALGTLLSAQLGTSPWNVGTGASQAVLGLAGFGVVLAIQKIDTRYRLIAALFFALLPALFLDLRAVGYPKPAHLLSLVIGCLIGMYYCYKHHRKC